METGSVSAVPQPPSGSRLRRHRLWIGIVVAIAALVAAAALLVWFGPQLVARQVVRTYLAGLNIDTSGVDTLRIKLLQGYLSFGPVTFRGADATAGQVGRIGVSIDVGRLLQRKALVRSIVIEGVRFEIRQADDGSFSLNGIPLEALLAEQAERPGAAEPSPDVGRPEAPSPPQGPRTLKDELGWYAGLDQLEIRDSRVVFLDARGGEAVMHVHRLELAGFHTWAPETPGKYSLDAELNEIGLTASGIAKPFADKIEVEGEAAVTGIKVTRIERFLGPLGFTSRAGRVDLAVSNVAIALFAAGDLDARLAATGTVTGVDLAHPLFGSGRLALGTLGLENVSVSYEASQQATLSGDLDIDLQASALRFGDGTEAGFSRARFGLPGTTVKTAPGRQPEINVAPRLDVVDLRLNGPDVRGTVGTASARLNGFSIEGTEVGAPFLASGSVAVERVDLRLPAAEPIAIVVDEARLDLAETRIAFPPGRGARVEGGVALDTRRLSVAIQAAAPAGQPMPPPVRIDAGRVSFEMPALAFDNTRATDVNGSAKGPRLSVDDLRLGGPDVRGSVGQASLLLSSLAMAGNGAPLVASGTMAADRVDLLLPDAGPVAIAMGQLRAELAETRVGLRPGAASLAGGFALDTRELLVSIQEQARRDQPPPPPTRIEAARVSVAVPTVTTEQGADTGLMVRAAKPNLTLDRLRLGGPDIQGTVGNAVIRLSGVDVEASTPGAPFVATGKVLARDLDLLVPDAEPVAIIAREVDADLVRTRFAFPSGRVLIEGAVAVDTNELSILVHQRPPGGGSAPLPPIGIFASRFAGEVPRLMVEDSRATGTRVKVTTPGMTLDRFRLDKPKDQGKAMQLAASTVTLRRIDVDVTDAETLEVAGQGDVSAPDLSVVMSADADDGAAPSPIGEGKINALDLKLRRFSYREAGPSTGFGMEGRIGLAALRGAMAPGRPGEAADRLALSRLELNVADLDIVKGGDHPAWRARLDLGLGSLTAEVNGPLSLRAAVDDVSLSRLNAASGGPYALGTLTLGRFDASLTRLSAAETPTPPEPDAPRESPPHTWPPADLPTVQVGRVALVDGGRIALVDTTVAPPVDATLVVDTLSLENLDTTNPAARSELAVEARLDDAAIRVQGWAEPFRPKPSFALQADIDDLQLPTLWPYIAPKVGLDVFRGTLTLGARADVTAGQLDGTIDARFVGVRMKDRLNADREEIARTIGVPLSTLISLLEDRDGSLAVAVPVSGDLLSPDVNYTSAALDLLPRVLRAFVTSPVGFVSSTLSLVDAATSSKAPPPPREAAAARAGGGQGSASQ